MNFQWVKYIIVCLSLLTVLFKMYPSQRLNMIMEVLILVILKWVIYDRLLTIPDGYFVVISTPFSKKRVVTQKLMFVWPLTVFHVPGGTSYFDDEVLLQSHGTEIFVHRVHSSNPVSTTTSATTARMLWVTVNLNWTVTDHITYVESPMCAKSLLHDMFYAIDEQNTDAKIEYPKYITVKDVHIKTCPKSATAPFCDTCTINERTKGYLKYCTKAITLLKTEGVSQQQATSLIKEMIKKSL